MRLLGLLTLYGCSGGSGAPNVAPPALNSPPVAAPDMAQTAMGRDVTIPVLSNDSDPDNDPLQLLSVAAAGNGTTAISGLHIIYTPAAGFSGTDQFSYSITDGGSGIASGTVVVTVMPQTTKAVTDAAWTSPNNAVALYVLDNDTPGTGEALSIASVGVPLHGTVVIDDNGTPETGDDYLWYTPDTGFSGIDSLVYTLAGGSSASVELMVSADPSLSASYRATGSLIKGAVQGAVVEFFEADNSGNTAGPPVAQTVTDDEGQFSVQLPLPRRGWIATSRGGRFYDETRAATDGTGQMLTLEPTQGLSAFLPGASDYLAINMYTNALLLRARSGAVSGDFEDHFTAVRSQFSAAVGVDLLSAPQLPARPTPLSTDASRQYALALGGIANATASAAVQLGVDRPTYAIIEAMVRDLSDCWIDGRNMSGRVTLTLSGALLQLPDTIDLNRQIVRFRNNNFDRYSLTPPVEVDRTACGTFGPGPGNGSPTGISLSRSAVDERATGGTVVGVFSTTDADPADSHSYTLVAGAGDSGNASFTISGANLQTAASFDYETQASYSIRVRTNDGVSTPYEQVFTISVNDLNESPTAISLAASAVDENRPVGTVVGAFGTTDEDTADTHSYTLVPGTGDTGNASFTISGANLQTAASFDYETQAGYSIRVRTDDGVSTPYEQVFAITVNDLNESPTAISLSASTVDENLPVGTTVGALGTTDEDPADSHSYTLVAGAGDSGNASFTISGANLQTAASFDYETQAGYSIRVRTDDGISIPYEQVFAITVNDLNESPTAVDDSSLTRVGTAVAVNVMDNDSDPDGDTLQILSVTTPSNGTAVINDAGTPLDTSDDFVDYTPSPAYSGPDSFSYTLGDGVLSDTATVTLAVDDNGYIASVSPPDAASYVAVATNVDLVFNQAMNAATIDATTLVISVNSDGSLPHSAAVSYDPGTLTATIDPGVDLDPGTVYWIIVSALIENAAGQPQGFEVSYNFTTTPTPNDTDSDGLTDAEEAAIPCLNAALADTDGDGVGDGAEYLAGGDPCVNQGQTVSYVDINGGVGGHAGWTGAATGIAASYADGASPTNPNYVLIASGTYLDDLNLATCSNLVFAGSQDTATAGAIALNTDGSPTTVIDMDNARNSELANCTDIVVRDIQFSRGTGNGGTKGGGMRVSGTSSVLLDSVWLTDNSVADQGGGLGVSNNSTATVRNSVIRDNLVTAGKGGGGTWVGANATLDIADTLVIDNISTGAGGGGLYFDPLSTGIVSNTTIVGNTAPLGGGIYILNNNGGVDTFVDIDSSYIGGNTATVDGGGVWINGTGAGSSAFAILHNRIVDNLASGQGGGFLLSDTGAIVTVQNNFVVANRSTGEGAAFAATSSGAPRLLNNTVLYNRSSAATGAAVAATGTASPIVTDSIFWGNRAANRPLSAAVSGSDNYMPSVSASNFNLLDTDKIGASDIDFVTDGVTPDFASGFYLNQATSVAVDTGSDTAAFLGLDTRYTDATGIADAGTVDRGFHFAANATYPADGYVEVGGAQNNEVAVSDAATGGNAVEVLIRPLRSGVPLGPGHLLVATLEGGNTTLAQLQDSASTDPLSDGESVVLADLGDGNYRGFIEAQGTTGAPVTIALRIHVDEVAQPLLFPIDRVP